MSDIYLYDTIFTYLISRLIIEKKIIITKKEKRYWLCTIKSNK